MQRSPLQSDDIARYRARLESFGSSLPPPSLASTAGSLCAAAAGAAAQAPSPALSRSSSRGNSGGGRPDSSSTRSTPGRPCSGSGLLRPGPQELGAWSLRPRTCSSAPSLLLATTDGTGRFFPPTSNNSYGWFTGRGHPCFTTVSKKKPHCAETNFIHDMVIAKIPYNSTIRFNSHGGLSA
eukprot:TRINITY_DN17829_c0_g1_i2.p2 TRINITY_DN17829_c0_g1~~TRINITY_DN17829_c0_g1_i2.p2  ORF type:complete len:181 (-),score=26.36 TRINITY_DN17829_c0_g1_i2:150-692(-)